MATHALAAIWTTEIVDHCTRVPTNPPGAFKVTPPAAAKLAFPAPPWMSWRIVPTGKATEALVGMVKVAAVAAVASTMVSASARAKVYEVPDWVVIGVTWGAAPRDVRAAAAVAAAVPPWAIGSAAVKCVPTTVGAAEVPPRSPAMAGAPRAASAAAAVADAVPPWAIGRAAARWVETTVGAAAVPPMSPAGGMMLAPPWGGLTLATLVAPESVEALVLMHEAPDGEMVYGGGDAGPRQDDDQAVP